MRNEMKSPAIGGQAASGGKKIVMFFALLLMIVGSLSLFPPTASAADPAVDKEFLPGFNAYGRDNSVFISSCTRFVPGNSGYASYFDLAVKNDLGAGYPMKASLRTAVSPTIPNTSVLKSYTQSTFNNYAMSGNLLSRFSANDSQGLTLTVGSNYFVCIDDLTNDNATGWFYTTSVSGGYSIQGYPGDVQNTFSGSFGFRTYYIPVSTGGTNDTTGTTGTNGTAGAIKSGSGPSSNTSSAIGKPTNVLAVYSAEAGAVVVSWKASATTTTGGYNIYRTETAGNNYKKIADSGKTTTTLSDTAVTAGKTYYYMIRAYKDDAESVSSNEAKVDIPAGAVIKAPVAARTATPPAPYNKKFEMNKWTWGGLGLAVVLLGVLIFLILKRKKTAKNDKENISLEK
ncbi:MAG: hypothetical protein NTW79_01450 [Candidatus Berkelbacteria bacterium]|nr:hypothetical protein [Candidatus Berkelbacteria bacterium]